MSTNAFFEPVRGFGTLPPSHVNEPELDGPFHCHAVQILGRAISFAAQIALQPSYLDKPQSYLPFLSDAVADGQIYLLIIPGGVNFQQDGIRYMEQEQR
ncbi:hypothetical protein DFH94DRAFT_694145 [Russula ochroleuca]|uniref:Uncharacterized protein n=1 Tax=Russula ochroleuca TaxID=152965 RepID=A0A9P5T668_9AGAM|nr:hypothetical protein DFH94DRAFT_694145 [Russula ochroleuca]